MFFSWLKEKPLMTERNRENCFPNVFDSDAKAPIREVEKLNLKELSTNLPGEKRKNKSLFALNLERQGKLKSFYDLDKQEQPIKGEQTHMNTKLNGKQLISGVGLGNPKEVEQIHKENLEKLSNMNPEEILSEQQKLIQQLDPKILAFIRKRNKNDESSSVNMETQSTDAHLNCSKETLTLNKEDILNNLPIKPDKKWLNMNKIEYEKLEWMIKPKNVVKRTSTSDSNESATARFDFSGNLISPNDDIPVTKALHHHGKI
jgi:hypothetical protein